MGRRHGCGTENIFGLLGNTFPAENKTEMSVIRAHIDACGEDGEDDEGATVDDRGRADAEDAGAREDKDNCDRAQAEADIGSDVPQGNSTRGDAGATKKWSLCFLMCSCAGRT